MKAAAISPERQTALDVKACQILRALMRQVERDAAAGGEVMVAIMVPRFWLARALEWEADAALMELGFEIIGEANT